VSARSSGKKSLASAKPNKHRKTKKMQQNLATYCQLQNEHTKPKHQNKTATPLRLTKAPMCPDTKPQNRQTCKTTDAQQQQQQQKNKTCPTQKNPNKIDMRQKEEVAVKGEGATGPSRQLFQRLYPHTPL
jgi:hypothetical protein